MTPRFVVKYNKYAKLSLADDGDRLPTRYYVYDNIEHLVQSRWFTFDSAADHCIKLNKEAM